jgi:hypothetical protein
LGICENKIKKIEKLPNTIESLSIALNFIENLSENLLEYEELKELNISGNLLSSFKDIIIISKIKKLEELNLNDPNFGENPICLMNNYRLFVLHLIPKLKILDEAFITKEEYEEYEYIYQKKSTFYKNKIKQMNRISKLSFKLLKIFSWSFKMMKSLQILFFRKRIKMLQYIQYERISQNLISGKNLNNNKNSNMDLNSNSNEKLIEKADNDIPEKFNSEKIQQIEKENSENFEYKNINNKIIKDLNINSNDFNFNYNYIYINQNNTVSQNILKDDVIEEMNKEIEITNEKIKKCLNNFQTVYENLNIIKKYIAEINDFSIIW